LRFEQDAQHTNQTKSLSKGGFLKKGVKIPEHNVPAHRRSLPLQLNGRARHEVVIRVWLTWRESEKRLWGVPELALTNINYCAHGRVSKFRVPVENSNVNVLTYIFEDRNRDEQPNIKI
jgi:hypothetical protein